MSEGCFLPQQYSKDNELDFIRISLLYKNAPFSIFGIFIIFSEIIFIIKDVMSPQFVLFWSIVTFSSLLPRIYIAYAFHSKLKKSEITPLNIQKWETLWAGSIILFALLVSSLVYFPIEKDQLIVFLFISLIITGLGIGSIVISNTSIKTALPFFSLISFPFIIRCYIEGEPYYQLLGTIGLTAYLIFTRLLFSLNKTTIENIRLQVENKNNSLKDPLTGLWNRRRLYLYIEEVIPRAIRRNNPFSIVLLDIDHFKKINDSMGHDSGDKFLIQVSRWISELVRDEDLVVRYGGEEFMIVMPSADIQEAKNLTTRILKHIRENSEHTISAGIASYSSEMNFNDLVIQADEALYLAKQGGRNRFVVATKSIINMPTKKILPFNKTL